ncbi:MAG: Sapep family Mn(2+)-dependent dipeptidase [Coriobacteriales bacterium]|nr:Sapep family Mn(2+)-dependent dipeptidase [Coriobacteriales bacterium]
MAGGALSGLASLGATFLSVGAEALNNYAQKEQEYADRQALLEEIDAYVDEVWPSVLNDLATLVAIPSVANSDNAVEGSPYGVEAHKALSCGLDICGMLGLEPHDCDGWIGYADLPGKSSKYIATIAHLDVVPAGTGWSSDPYSMIFRDGYLMGRGVLDDKGPAVLSMYAAHYFARQVFSGRELPYTLRVILGSDEEVGMNDVDYYLKHFEEPAFLFTPDAEYPVCCGEKGRVEGKFTSSNFWNGIIKDFNGGTVSNAIPSLATCTIEADIAALPEAEGIDIEPSSGSLVKLTAHGIGGHASRPEGTVNAIGMIVNYLVDNFIVMGDELRFCELLRRIFASSDGSTLGIAATDDLFDPLTCIGGTIKFENGRLVQTVDIRYPKSTNGDYITNRLAQIASVYDATFAQTSDMVPFYIDPQNPCVQALIDAYNEVTGKKEKPFTIGGGTYARHFKNAVSFGPEEPGELLPEWVGTIHGPDEGVSEELLRRSLKIYIYALEKLMATEIAE